MLTTQLWVSALIRRAEVAGAFAAIVARGDDIAGDVLVKVNLLDGRARVFAPQSDMSGRRTWIEPLGAEQPQLEQDVDAFIVRRRDIDPDAWVVEVEDRAGRTFIAD